MLEDITFLQYLNDYYNKFRMERKRYKKSIIWTKNILNSIYYINYQYLYTVTDLNACV